MESYGAVPDPETGEARASASRRSGQQLKGLMRPIFLENPDGTIIEATPLHYRDPKAGAKGRSKATGSSTGSQDAARAAGDSDSGSDRSEVLLSGEVDYLYSRHERVFTGLLCIQLMLDGLYDYVYVVRMLDGTSAREFQAVYGPRVSLQTGQLILWITFALHNIFTLVYYGAAVNAMWTKQPSSYRLLADIGMLGIAGLVLLAYVDKFNLILFFLYLVSFIYARFLQGLTVSLLLLPPARREARTAA